MSPELTVRLAPKPASGSELPSIAESVVAVQPCEHVHPAAHNVLTRLSLLSLIK